MQLYANILRITRFFGMDKEIIGDVNYCLCMNTAWV